MSDDLLSEIQACINNLTPQQKEGLREVFSGEEEEDGKVPKPGRRGKEKDGIHKCDIILKCTLCKSEHRTTMQSSSPLPSTMEIPTCGLCVVVLHKEEKEDLVMIAIAAADGAYAAVKEAKNAPVESPTIPEWKIKED